MRCCWEALETMSQVAYRTRPTKLCCLAKQGLTLSTQHMHQNSLLGKQTRTSHGVPKRTSGSRARAKQSQSIAQHSTAQHTCASIFSSFHAVLGSTCAAAAGPCACWLASAGGSCGAGPRGAAGAATAAAVGGGCSLAFSARSCTSQNRTQCQ